MPHTTEMQIQKLIDLEIILILIALGIDAFIQALSAGDPLSAALIVLGLCVVGAIYWHTLHIDRLIEDIRGSLHHLFTAQALVASTLAPTIPLPASTSTKTLDVPLSTVDDRPIIHVSNFPLSKRFYERALAPLNYQIISDFPALSFASFGVSGASDLWIRGDGVEQTMRAAFAAPSRAAVTAFFNNALEVGGSKVETPDLRADRGANFYSAAVLDPDNYTIEAFYQE